LLCENLTTHIPKAGRSIAPCTCCTCVCVYPGKKGAALLCVSPMCVCVCAGEATKLSMASY
jgi:hypothetical protein